MKLLVIVWFVTIPILLLFFLFDNISTAVDLVVFKQTHGGLSLAGIIAASAAIGVLYVGVPAVAEGAYLRFSNRRLRREIHKLETELNYLRTQPPTSGRTDSALATTDVGGAAKSAAAASSPAMPTAPVYDVDDDGDAGDDDDVYSGGRAV